MCGHIDPVYPSPLKLGDHDLPWVENATHLGHELHQLCNMEHDASVKRAQFIEYSVQIQETFGFAQPNEILHAVQTYAGHWYGPMLWDLYGEKVGQIYKSWSTCAKLTWGVSRSTHNFSVDNLLTAQFLTVKQQLVGRYVDFVQKLLKSTSPEVSMVCNMVARSGKNLVNIQRETNLDPWSTASWKIREKIGRAEIPAFAGWRIQYLGKLLDDRRELDTKCESIDEVNLLIEGLCHS